ncbi:MAG TPA: rhodanese-like domain-containing protein [Solirubrobacteraceae bacterium]|nr:rhodanese-like domain-containing protein [Solirubrobacteraceae bacterium]
MFFTRKPSITPEQAAAGAARRELLLVDVRQPAELRSGRVHGAVNIPLTQLRARLHELERGRQVAFLCHSGARSSRATAIAMKAGYDAVNVRGGVIAWNRAGLPLTR